MRVKGGVYNGDLGLVDFIEENNRALIRLIPRIPNEAYADA